MKLSRKIKNRIRGSITVLMVIIMLPMMTMSAIIVDSSRINMARSMISGAGDLTMNTALANYDTILKDVYGLFAMSQNQTDDELAASLKNYFSKTLVSYGITNEAESGDYVDQLMGDFKEMIANSKNGKPTNFLDMNIVDFTATKARNSSLANPDVMRSQIVEYMKYRAPLNFGLSFLDSLKSFKSVQAQNEVVKKQVEAQESSQDVTSTCKESIKAIREYDKLIDSILKGDKAVKGKQNKSDGQTVHIKEYHTQVDRYYKGWGNDNYMQANKLMMVFLLKSPSVNSLYLKNLNVNRSEWFVKSDNSGLNMGNTGINISVSTASSTSEARSQVESQASKLNNTGGLERKTASAYANKNFLSYSNISGNTFTNEENAINTFIDYENFLTNAGSIKYNDVKTTLEGLYTLGKYYENFENKINSEISSAEQTKQNADNALNNANNNSSNSYNNIAGSVGAINRNNSNYRGNYSFLQGVRNGDNEDLRSVVAGTLTQASMPGYNKSTSDFSNFINYNYKERSGDSDNKFLKVFKEIIDSSVRLNGENGNICTVASNYLNDVANRRTNQSLYNYVRNNAGNESVNTDLFALLSVLYNDSIEVGNISANIDSYNNAVGNYSQLQKNANDARTNLENKKTIKSTVRSTYTSCISHYNSFGKKYQNDIQYYGQYIDVAKAVVGAKVSAVNSQFTNIKNNVDSIIKKLDEIGKKLTATYKAIDAYNTKVDSWKTSNNTYTSQNSKDSFSKQNSADIKTAKSNYDLKSLETLQKYVESVKKEYQDFFNRITDNTHFKYGSKKIDTIKTSDEMKSAVPSNVKDSLPTVVSVANANGKIGHLYNSEATGAIEISEPQSDGGSGTVVVEHYKFLEPMLKIQFLKYLNEAYADDSKLDEPTKSNNNTVKGEYEKTKKEMKDNNKGEEVKDDADTDKYGYSYKGKSTSGTLPSKDKEAKSSSNAKFKISEEKDKDGNEKVNASSGFSEQSSALDTILSGIKDVASNTLENTYILSYIFNNFSYNTMIQDMTISGEKVDTKNASAALVNAKNVLGSDAVSKYKDNAKMLSNYKKNAKHNYFYGAEIEYILYGNSSADKNVTYTKASIYAIRFAFDAIYAFTNSEIRNTTMSVGLAVQAATLGVVPYQLVQIIMQLALAAAEAALDLDMMNHGLKVAVVKTDSTWQLSISNAIKSAGELVANEAANLATKTINEMADGLQNLVDAGIDEVNSSLRDVSSDLTAATQNKVNEVTETAFSFIQSKIEEKLNFLQYVDYAKTNAQTAVDSAFNELESSLQSELEEQFSGNEIAQKVLPHITSRLSGILSTVKGKVNDVITNVPSGKDASDMIVSKMNDIKKEMLSTINDAISVVNQRITGVVDDVTAKVKGELNGYISESAGKLTEETSKQIKEKATNTTNNFINKYLDDGSASKAIGGGTEGVGGKNGSSVASMIKFGYKDYLMLFTFIAICVSDDAILARTADMIQLNIQNATTANGALFQHELTGTDTPFTMSNARTYISVHADVKLDMLFLNMDFFTRLFTEEDGGGTSTVDVTPAASMSYNGFLGY